MVPERIAVVTVLICIGVLLLSACGLPAGPAAPRVRPMVLYGDFYVLTRDAHPALLAYGSIDGTSNLQRIPARLTFAAPDCLGGQKLELLGAVQSRLTGRTVFESAGGGPGIEIAAETVGRFDVFNIDVLPFEGVLTRTHSCADLDRVPVSVHRLPVLGTTWRGSAAAKGLNLLAVTLTLQQKRTGTGTVEVMGSLTLSGEQGMTQGWLQGPVLLDPMKGPYRLEFKGVNGRSVTLVLAVANLLDLSHALPVQMTVRGEPYGGLELQSALSSPYPQ